MSTAAAAPLDRFVVLSILEDLHPCALVDSNEWRRAADAGAVADGEPRCGEPDEEEPLSARASSDVHEEPLTRRRQRAKALQALPALSARLGPRWAEAEVVPFLLRCLEECDPELSRGICVVLPQLVQRRAPGGAAGAAPSTNYGTRDGGGGALLLPLDVEPVLTALCVSDDAVTRELAVAHTLPAVLFGATLLEFCAEVEVRSAISGPSIGEATSEDTERQQHHRQPTNHRHPHNRDQAQLQLTLPATYAAEWHWASAAGVVDVQPACDMFDRVMRVDARVRQCAAPHAHHTDPCCHTLSAFDAVAGSSTNSTTSSVEDDAASVLLFTVLNALHKRARWTFARTAVVRLVAILVGACTRALSSHSPAVNGLQSLEPENEEAMKATLSAISCRQALHTLMSGATSSLSSSPTHTDDSPIGSPRTTCLGLLGSLASRFVATRMGLDESKRRPDKKRSGGVQQQWFEADNNDHKASAPLILVHGELRWNSVQHMGRGSCPTQRNPVEAAHVIRSLPYVVIPRASDSDPLAAILPTICAAVPLLEQSLHQDRIRVDAVVMTEEVQQYAERHDDSLCGSNFEVFHAVLDATEGLLGVTQRCPSGDGLVALTRLLRLLLARSAHYSSWKHRFFLLRRLPALLDRCSDALLADVAAACHQERHSLLTPGPQRHQKPTVQQGQAVLDMFCEILRDDIMGVMIPLLCGDVEVEVRCAVAHHLCDPVRCMAKLVLALRRCGELDEHHAGELVKGVAEGFVSAAQVCAMDVSDRVRASAASAIVDMLLLFAEGPTRGVTATHTEVGHVQEASGTPNPPWAQLASKPTSAKVVDACMSILMDLFRDDHHLVQLSVMQRFGTILVRCGGAGDGGAATTAAGASWAAEPARGSPSSVVASIGGRLESELLKLCRSLQASPVWRVRERYVRLVAKLLACVVRAAGEECLFRHHDSGAAHRQVLLTRLARDALLPLVVEGLFDSVKVVRDAALEYVAAELGSCFANNKGAEMEFVNEHLWPKLRAHPKATSTYLFRCALLRAAVVLNVDAESNLFPLLEQLRHDAVPNVRMIVCREIQALCLRVTPKQREMYLAPLLRGLLEDPCADVRSAASAAWASCV